MTLPALRARLGWTQDKLARVLDVQSRTVSAWETAATEPPRAVLLLLAIWADERCPEWASPPAVQ